MEREVMKRHERAKARSYSRNSSLPPSFLHKILRYEPETGRLFWKTERELAESGATVSKHRSRFQGGPALSAMSSSGYYAGTIKSIRCYRQDVVWAMHKGEWPDFVMEFIDGDSRNTRIENLRPKMKKVVAKAADTFGDRRGFLRWWEIDSEIRKVFCLDETGTDVLWNVAEYEDVYRGEVLKFKDSYPAFTKQDSKSKLYYLNIGHRKVYKHLIGHFLWRGEHLRGQVTFLNGDTGNIHPENMVYVDKRGRILERQGTWEE